MVVCQASPFLVLAGENDMKFDKLEQNIIDMIKEEQAKLGYRRENIRRYYPLSSLVHLTGEKLGEQEMLALLTEFGKKTKTCLGGVTVAAKKERFCFLIPEEGVAYVKEHTRPNEFIRDLVELVGKHGCTMEEIKALFEKQPWPVTVEPVKNGEFDILIRFDKEADDPYYYCFKDEGCHIIYHRFLPEDYADFEF